MYDIMIIDDEPDVREHLVSIIDWESLPVRLAAQASDMDSAREMYLTCHPRIIITDISLPMGSGLDLMEEFLKEDPSLQCIVITGYSEFSYARQALRLGVTEFLLKPIFADAINQSLRKAALHFQSLKEQETSLQNLRELLDKNRHSVRDAYLGHLFRQETIMETDEMIRAKFEQLHISCPGPFYCVALVALAKDPGIPDYESSCLLVEKQLDELCSQQPFSHYLFFDSHFRLSCIVSSENEQIDQQMVSLLDKLKNRLSVIDQLLIYAGISCTISSPALLNQAFYQAKSALNYQNILSDDSVIHYRDVSMYRPASATGHTSANELLRYFKVNDYEALRNSLILHIKTLMDKENGLTPVRSFAFEVLAAISSECTRQQISITGVMASPDMMGLLSGGSADVIRDTLLHAISQMMELQQMHYSSSSNHLINLAKTYIMENLSDPDLNLDSVSQAIGLSRSYFCHLFHQTETVSFSNYLTSLRIRKAQSLLKESNLKVFEVANAVGFNNVKYFCFVFKKVTGATPSEYQSGNTDIS